MDDVALVNPSDAVRISSTSHRVRVIAESRADVIVVGDATVDRNDPAATVIDVHGPLTVRVPEGTSVVIGSTSGRVQLVGALGDVAVLSDSGRIEIGEAGSVDARTTSARVTIGSARGSCRLRTGSGRIEVGACRGADVATDSGRITLRHVDGPVEAHCVSGRIDIELDAAHDVAAETVSGRVTVSLPGGVDAHESSGPAPSIITPPGCDCTVSVRSVSGRVEVTNR